LNRFLEDKEERKIFVYIISYMLLVMNQSSIIPFSNRKRDNTPLQISSSKLRERVRKRKSGARRWVSNNGQCFDSRTTRIQIVFVRWFEKTCELRLGDTAESI